MSSTYTLNFKSGNVIFNNVDCYQSVITFLNYYNSWKSNGRDEETLRRYNNISSDFFQLEDNEVSSISVDCPYLLLDIRYLRTAEDFLESIVNFPPFAGLVLREPDESILGSGPIPKLTVSLDTNHHNGHIFLFLNIARLFHENHKRGEVFLKSITKDGGIWGGVRGNRERNLLSTLLMFTCVTHNNRIGVPKVELDLELQENHSLRTFTKGIGRTVVNNIMEGNLNELDRNIKESEEHFSRDLSMTGGNKFWTPPVHKSDLIEVTKEKKTLQELTDIVIDLAKEA